FALDGFFSYPVNPAGATPVLEVKVAEDVLEPRLRRIVADLLGVSPEELTPQVSLTDDLAADSLDLIELALAIETHLGIAIPERAGEKIRTYGDLVQAARAHAEPGEAPRQPAPAPGVSSRLRSARRLLAAARTAIIGRRHEVDILARAGRAPGPRRADRVLEPRPGGDTLRGVPGVPRSRRLPGRRRDERARHTHGRHDEC